MTEFKSWQSYWDFTHSTRRESRFIRTEETEDFLRCVLATSEHRRRQIKKDKIFWRAQIGHVWRPEYQDDEYIDDFPSPFLPERMKPLAGKAKEGRANPKGIPYLYLATEKETAMSEVRPGIGSPISVGQFKILHDLSVLDFSVNQDLKNLYFEEPDPQEREKAVWAYIERGFSEPVERTDNSAEYVPTQIITELFKSEGYDGIAYKSAFGKNGYNVVLFDIEAASIVNCFLYEAKAIEFDFQETANPYFIRKKEDS